MKNHSKTILNLKLSLKMFQVEESTIRQRLGGRRDSAAQISSPPSSPPNTQRRRRSSLAQLTDILREWSGTAKKTPKPPLNRRETLADIARNLPWGRSDNNPMPDPVVQQKRRESSVDSGIRSLRSRHETQVTDFHKFFQVKECSMEMNDDDVGGNYSRRGSGDGRRDSSHRAITPPPPKVVGATRKQRDSLTVTELPNFRSEQRPSTSSTASDHSGPHFVTVDTR